MTGAVFLQRQREARDGAGHADAERGIARFCVVGLAVGSEEDIARCRRRCGLAIIDRDVFIAAGAMNHHEAAAADIAGARIGDGECKTGGDCGIDGIPALAQDIGADLGGDLLLRHHEAVLGGDRMNAVGRRRHIGVAREGARGKEHEECKGRQYEATATSNRHHQIAPQVRANPILSRCYSGQRQDAKTRRRDRG